MLHLSLACPGGLLATSHPESLDEPLFNLNFSVTFELSPPNDEELRSAERPEPQRISPGMGTAAQNSIIICNAINIDIKYKL